jgi:tRNA threonylcarbamoyladenosine biosynthesis protein TsaE
VSALRGVHAVDDAAAMRALGRRIGEAAVAGDLIVLSGPLGAGKTTLAQGIGDGLGVRGPITSPTFVLARVHPGPVPMVHADAYRLGDDADLEALDLDADLDEAVTVVEWGEGRVEHLADSCLLVRIERAVGDGAERDAERRTVTVLRHT